jgi:hypothetical protein
MLNAAGQVSSGARVRSTPCLLPLQVGNSGMFRPEMLRPMGLPEDVNVIAWGLSLVGVQQQHNSAAWNVPESVQCLICKCKDRKLLNVHAAVVCMSGMEVHDVADQSIVNCMHSPFTNGHCPTLPAAYRSAPR